MDAHTMVYGHTHKRSRKPTDIHDHAQAHTQWFSDTKSETDGHFVFNEYAHRCIWKLGSKLVRQTLQFMQGRPPPQAHHNSIPLERSSWRRSPVASIENSLHSPYHILVSVALCCFPFLFCSFCVFCIVVGFYCFVSCFLLFVVCVCVRVS